MLKSIKFIEESAVEAPAEGECKHGDILVGKATVKAHKHGWSLLGGRFVSQKCKAIHHAQLLNNAIYQCR